MGPFPHNAHLPYWCAWAWILTLAPGLTRWGENGGLASPESPMVSCEGETRTFLSREFQKERTEADLLSFFFSLGNCPKYLLFYFLAN